LSKVYTIEQLNGYIERLFAEEEVIHGISVQGEVSGFSVSNKTAFFVLKDGAYTLSCIFYTQNIDSTAYFPKNGERVIAAGTPQYSKKFGSLRFSVSGIRPFGKGELYERFLQLKETLRLEGLFDEARKRPVPQSASEIAVITSAEGAVIHDIVTTARSRNPFLNILIYPVRVQGAGADAAIIAALNELNKHKPYLGAVIIARGGGSAEDLENYNSEALARAVAASRLPVISAVGHETDITLCDLAADLRTATPTAAAVAVTTDIFSEIGRIKAAAASLSRRFADFYTVKRAALVTAGRRLSAAAGANLSARRNLLLTGASRLRSLSETFLDNKLNALNQCRVGLDKSNPLRLLESGYAKLIKDGPVYSVNQLKAGDKLDVYLQDGVVGATVDKINKKVTGKKYL